jgi:hypothetical protein
MSPNRPVVGDEIVVRMRKIAEDELGNPTSIEPVDFDGYWGGVDADDRVVLFLRGMHGPGLACVQMSKHLICGCTVYPKARVPPPGKRGGHFDLVSILNPPTPSIAESIASPAET